MVRLSSMAIMIYHGMKLFMNDIGRETLWFMMEKS